MKQKKYLVFLSCCLLFSLFAFLGCTAQNSETAMVQPNDLQVHFIDVGQGDSILVQTPGTEKNILIDAGPREAGSTVVQYLKDHGVKQIDLLIATHPHEDHIGGLIEVLNHFPVQQVIDSGKRHTSKTYRNYLKLIVEKKIPLAVAKKQEFSWGEKFNFAVLGPIKNNYEDLNNYSVVSKLTYGQISFLFTGDMEKEAERDIAGQDLRATILKVGHHGSRTSTSAQFLRQVKPEVGVISVGQGNDYHHPHEITLKKLAKVGVKVYRTDLNGSVTVTTDGEEYSIKTER